MPKDSADVLVFPALTVTVCWKETPDNNYSDPKLRQKGALGHQNVMTSRSDTDSRVRLLRHLIRLHGLTG